MTDSNRTKVILFASIGTMAAVAVGSLAWNYYKGRKRCGTSESSQAVPETSSENVCLVIAIGYFRPPHLEQLLVVHVETSILMRDALRRPSVVIRMQF